MGSAAPKLQAAYGKLFDQSGRLRAAFCFFEELLAWCRRWLISLANERTNCSTSNNKEIFLERDNSSYIRLTLRNRQHVIPFGVFY